MNLLRVERTRKKKQKREIHLRGATSETVNSVLKQFESERLLFSFPTAVPEEEGGRSWGSTLIGPCGSQ